jgi:hypothetical protein
MGIAETRATFGHPSLFQLTKNLLSRFPPFGGRTISASINITLEGIACSSRANLSHSAGENPTIESRLKVTEKNIELLNQRIDTTFQEMDLKFNKVNGNLEQEEQMRATEDRTIREQLEATATGGIHISAMGTVWLFFGIILSNASQELSQWLK